MGKTARWFRGLLGGKKSSDSPAASSGSDAKEKKKWDFVKSSNDNEYATKPPATKAETRVSSTVGPSSPYVDRVDASKHAIAVAAATAAVAEAALAAAQAARAVVRLTSGGSRATTAYVSGSNRRWEVLAAIKIQSAFRGFLARRALRALKGLVKLQALVRGHIVRKQSADMFRRMQALVRVQARARAVRAYSSESSHSSSKSSLSHHPSPAAPDKYVHQFRANSSNLDHSSILKRRGSKASIKDIIDLDKAHLGSNWLDHWMEESSWNNRRDASLKTWHAEDEKRDKILEVDTWKPHLNSKQSNRTFRTSQHVLASGYNDQSFTTFGSPSKCSTRSLKPIPGLSSGEGLSLRSLKFPCEVDEASLCTAENSPQVISASSRPGSSAKRGPFTPARSECSQSFFSRYLDHPNYMSNTESSRAKFRSQSAPRQRIEFEKASPTKRPVHGIWDAGTISQRGSVLQANFRSKAYSGSGRLDRLVLPVEGDTACFKYVYGSRC